MIGKEFGPFAEGIVAEIVSKKNPILYPDYEHHPHRVKELDHYHFKEVIGVPLIVREMIIGAMVVGTTDPKKHFRQNEIDLLFTFSHQAAIAIGNAKLYEDSLAKIRQLTTLYEIGKTLSFTLDLDELFKKALELLHMHFGYALCGILLLDRGKDELYIRHVTGSYQEGVKKLRFRVGLDGIVGWVAKGDPSHPRCMKDPRYIRGSPEEGQRLPSR
jgi:GAF domain-containing protein